MYNRRLKLTNLAVSALVFLPIWVSAQETHSLTPEQNVALEQGDFDSIATDFSKEIAAFSKDQKVDGRNKISILIDNVLITQGSLEIRADRIEADASAGKGAEVITALGSPATYQQRLTDGTLVSAQANTIIYAVATKTLSLQGEAIITQNQSMVNADEITYNMLEETITANSDQEQVKTIISFGEDSSSETSQDQPSEKREQQP